MKFVQSHAKHDFAHVLCKKSDLAHQRGDCAHNFVDNGQGHWNSGIKPDNLKCSKCLTEYSITEFKFDPNWGFGHFGLTFWNWNELRFEFINELEKIIGNELKIVRGKI